jgi:hypothetical protein
MACVVYVKLLEEGVECWRPVEAERLTSGDYVVVGSNESDGDEIWEFSSGAVVRCEHRMLSGGPRLVAVALVGASTKA